ncbi:hypothetical protein OAQ84_00995 [Bdellovibrionales bacterium]|nr:hypothetical protein [Bdellovibrionales bacterium]
MSMRKVKLKILNLTAIFLLWSGQAIANSSALSACEIALTANSVV